MRFFDFEEPANNEFVVTRQFRVQGPKKNIRPDLMLLVNGMPLVIIECKSPTLGEAWKLDALDQFSRYHWTRKEEIQREMRRLIKRQLRAAGYAPQKVESLAETLVDLMKRRRSS